MRDGSSPLLVRPAPEGARVLCLGYLDEAVAAAPRLNDLGDVEALHDFRVALRRLRSAMRAYRPLLADTVKKKWVRRLGEIARGTGEGRDTEVQLGWLRGRGQRLAAPEKVGARWLAGRLEERLNVAYAATRSRLLPEFEDLAGTLREALSTYELTVRLGEPASGPTFAGITAALVREQVGALREGLGRIDTPSDQVNVHEARIEAKRLRYLLEPLRAEVPASAEVIDRLKSLQDLLGELHDGHVMAAELASSGEQAAAERQRRLHEQAVSVPAPSRRKGRSGEARDERAGLLALARGVRADRERLYEQFLVEWSDAPAEAFFAVVGELADALERPAVRPPEDTEIERKYLLRAAPAVLKRAPWIDIAQGWIPGERIHERLRRSTTPEGERFHRTVKLGSGVRRVEVEDEISAELFRKLWPLTRGKRLEKRRYLVTEGDLTWEIDVFRGRRLVLAEVELPSEDTQVVLPAWLAPLVEREVTSESAYVNLNLAS